MPEGRGYIPGWTRHPDRWVHERLRAIIQSGWMVTLSKNETYWDITCKAAVKGDRMNLRISSKLGKNKKGRTARQELSDFLIKHEREHPGEL